MPIQSRQNKNRQRDGGPDMEQHHEARKVGSAWLMFQPSSLGRITVWPRLLTGNSSGRLGACQYGAWKSDIVSYDAGMSARPVVVLAGGVGAARFLRGLVRVVPPDEITVIGNTGDDMWWHGLYIAPDLDTVTYWLAGVADESRAGGSGRHLHRPGGLAQLTTILVPAGVRGP